ncbi:hypothetical protein BLNAU_12191 [Blattamonas nauphoetae]|uniref:Right handed beta helix domain-containing protein n=1 Tax=Blattamonas nauphoetae TaxID=2049346 RepID=A0ABQ9XRI8_9EUKA|nr:hypothetical protein BLNAU_12191 [Blattamonas nauphoetae]
MAGAILGTLSSINSQGHLTVKDCSFVECSSDNLGGALNVWAFHSCMITDCLIKDCFSGGTGAIYLQQGGEETSSISLTRVAFVNNSLGQSEESAAHHCVPEDKTNFVDVALNYLYGELDRTLSISDCYTTCAANSIGMHVTTNFIKPEESCTRLFDDAFNK